MTRETIQKEAIKASQLAGVRVLSTEEEAYLQALQVIMAIEAKKYNSFTEWTKYLGKLYAIRCKYGNAQLTEKENDFLEENFHIISDKYVFSVLYKAKELLTKYYNNLAS